MALKMEKILITDLEYDKARAVFLGCPDFTCLRAPAEESELAEAVRRENAKYVIVGVAGYQRELYDALPAGGVIARFGVGHDGIDKTLAKSKGIYCTNTPGVLDDSVAECAIAMMLTAARRLDRCAADMKNQVWQNRVGFELSGKTLAVIGCGNIGTKVARIAKFGFGMKIAGFDLATPKQPEFFDTFTADFGEAVKSADLVSLHIPSIPATRNFICRERLAQFKPTAWLINTARGGVVGEADLFDAVRAGRIGGAVLDVFRQEPYIPLPEKDLRSLGMVIMTPHIGSSTAEACNRMANAALENIRHCAAGRIDGMNRLV